MHKDFDCDNLAQRFGSKKAENGNPMDVIYNIDPKNRPPKSSNDPFVFVWNTDVFSPPVHITWNLAQKRLLDKKLVPEAELRAFAQELEPVVEKSYSGHYGSQKYIVAKCKDGPERGVLVMVGYSPTALFGINASFAFDEVGKEDKEKQIELDLTAIEEKNWNKIRTLRPVQQLGSLLFVALICDLVGIRATQVTRC